MENKVGVFFISSPKEEARMGHPRHSFVRGGFKVCDGLGNPMRRVDVLWGIHSCGSRLVLLREAQGRRITVSWRGGTGQHGPGIVLAST